MKKPYGFIVQPTKLTPPAVFASACERVKGFVLDNAGHLAHGPWVVDRTGPGTLFAAAVAAAGGRFEELYQAPTEGSTRGYDFGLNSGRSISEESTAVAPLRRRTTTGMSDTKWSALARQLSRVYILQMRTDRTGGLKEFLAHAEERGLDVRFVVPNCFLDGTVPPPVVDEPPRPHGEVVPTSYVFPTQYDVQRAPNNYLFLRLGPSKPRDGAGCVREVM